MGKKRNSEDMDEAKILKKIRKLEEKLTKKRNQEPPEAITNLSQPDDIYMPPSEWAGTVSSMRVVSPHRSDYNPSSMSLSPEQIREPVHEPVHESLGEPIHETMEEFGQDPIRESPSTEKFSPQPGPSSAGIAPQNDQDLDDSILNILGDAPKAETVLGPKVHKDVAARWQDILAKGLSKETKDKLVGEYLIPANCELLVPPLLNPEAKAALPENLVKRDFSLMSKQKNLAAALAALSRATEMLVTNDFSKEKLLKPISDASRLLCDAHNLETKTRRSFVIASINSNLKGALIDTSRDKYLFGENLTEKLNAAKAIQKSGDTLKYQNKTQVNKTNFNNNNAKFSQKVNSKALHSKTLGRSDAGQYRSATGRAPTGRTQPSRHAPARRTRSPPPPTPAHRAHHSTRR